MKRIPLALWMMLCILLLAGGSASAAEWLTACPDCGCTDLSWYGLNVNNANAHAQLCPECQVIVGDYETCTPAAGTATCVMPALCEVCRTPMHISLSPDPDMHVMQDVQYVWNVIEYDEHGMAVFSASASQSCSLCTFHRSASCKAVRSVTGEATCTQRGVLTYTADFEEDWAGTVSDSSLAVIDPLGHREKTDPMVAPTCTESGLTEGSRCERCGEVLSAQEVIPAFGHTVVTDSAVEPACTESGLTEGSRCKLCGEIFAAQEAIPALGHAYTTTTIDPTCGKEGRMTHTCTRCGDVYTEVIPEISHYFDLWTPSGDGMHDAPCRRCPYVSTRSCTTLAAVAEDGETILSVCPVCGEAGDLTFDAVRSAKITPAGSRRLPDGEAIVRGIAAPADGVLYAFTAAYEYSGHIVDFGTRVDVSLPLNIAGAFDLNCADAETGECTSVPFVYENGVLAFEAGSAALYLLMAE